MCVCVYEREAEDINRIVSEVGAYSMCTHESGRYIFMWDEQNVPILKPQYGWHSETSRHYPSEGMADTTLPRTSKQPRGYSSTFDIEEPESTSALVTGDPGKYNDLA